MLSRMVGVLAAGIVLSAIWAAGPASAADMQKFSRACLKNTDLLSVFANDANGPEKARQHFCGCLGEAFGPAVSQKQADMMTAQIAGTLTAAQKTAFQQDAALQTLSTTTMNQCIATTGISVAPRQAG